MRNEDHKKEKERNSWDLQKLIMKIKSQETKILRLTSQKDLRSDPQNSRDFFLKIFFLKIHQVYEKKNQDT